MKKLFIALWVFATGAFAQEDAVRFDWVSVEVNSVKVEVEYAHTWPQRAQGLMFRRELCAQCGMLFKFDYVRKASMWMKNTFVPLDVAFIRADGTIVDIKQLQPEDLTSVGSSGKVLYALEMNQGWFAKNNISEGDKIALSGFKSSRP